MQGTSVIGSALISPGTLALKFDDMGRATTIVGSGPFVRTQEYTLNIYAEAQPSLYRSGVGAPNYQIFTGIALQLPPRFTNSWHLF